MNQMKMDLRKANMYYILCHQFIQIKIKVSKKITIEENKKYIKDNILFHHDTLPMGEFAIGTNTTAYRMAKVYDIADKLPILIDEKKGPHFAVGDT